MLPPKRGTSSTGRGEELARKRLSLRGWLQTSPDGLLKRLAKPKKQAKHPLSVASAPSAKKKLKRKLRAAVVPPVLMPPLPPHLPRLARRGQVSPPPSPPTSARPASAVEPMRVIVHISAGQPLGMGIGIDEDGDTVIANIEKGSPAELCGKLQVTDRILQVNGRHVEHGSDMVDLGEFVSPRATSVEIIVISKVSCRAVIMARNHGVGMLQCGDAATQRCSSGGFPNVLMTCGTSSLRHPNIFCPPYCRMGIWTNPAPSVTPKCCTARPLSM